jgi:hypothetical protein
MKSKSSGVRIVCNLVIVAFDFFREEGFGGETFLFFKGSSSSLGSVTSPFFFSAYVPSISLPSPPLFGEMKVVFMDVLSKSQTSSVFFILLGPGVSDTVFVGQFAQGLVLSLMSNLNNP